jgi:predicted RNase H-like HicB family nuclease
MKFKGRVFQDKDFWLAEVPALNITSQGKSYQEALEMIKDTIESIINISKKDVKIYIYTNAQNTNIFQISSSHIIPILQFWFYKWYYKYISSLK